MNNSSKKRTFEVLSITTCLLAACLLFVAIYWRLLREREPGRKQQELCYREDRFYTSADDIGTCPLGLARKKRNESAVCCGTLNLVLDNIVAKVMLKRFNSDANPELIVPDLTQLNCKKDLEWKEQFMKFKGIAKNRKQEKYGNSSRILWNSMEASDFCSSLTYNSNKGTVSVNEAGFFFVQSQIKVRVYSKDDDIDNTITHSIFLKTAGQDKGTVILEGAKTKCELLSEQSDLTSILGAAFKLKEGDMLYVATSHPKLLTGEDNFFSIQRL